MAPVHVSAQFDTMIMKLLLQHGTDPEQTSGNNRNVNDLLSFRTIYNRPGLHSSPLGGCQVQL